MVRDSLLYTVPVHSLSYTLSSYSEKNSVWVEAAESEKEREREFSWI